MRRARQDRISAECPTNRAGHVAAGARGRMWFKFRRRTVSSAAKLF
jgi:hypothetical protein